MCGLSITDYSQSRYQNFPRHYVGDTLLFFLQVLGIIEQPSGVSCQQYQVNRQSAIVVVAIHFDFLAVGYAVIWWKVKEYTVFPVFKATSSTGAPART